jgi:hypothetical protein
MFDCLPLEVIREHIMPCLASFDRFHLNMLLKPHERIIGQIDAVKLKQVEILINQNKIKTALSNVDKHTMYSANHSPAHIREEFETKRIWSILELFETVKQNLTLTQYRLNFREAVLDKIECVLNELPETWSQMPEEFHLRFAKVFPALKNTILEDYPFMYHLELPNRADAGSWSAIGV